MQEAPDFESAKREALAALPALAGATQGLGVEQVLEAWIRFASTPFFCFFHRFDPRTVLPHLEADDEIGDGGYELDLYDPEYLTEAWEERAEEGLGGQRSFLIGGINGADELVFVSSRLAAGVAILSHDDVFCADDLDASIDGNIAYLNCSLERLFGLLEPRPDPRSLTD